MANKKPIVKSAKPAQQQKERILEGALNIAESEMELNFKQAIETVKQKSVEFDLARANLSRIERLYGADNFKVFAEKYKL